MKYEFITDGIFTMWSRRLSEIELILTKINSFQPSLQFTAIIGKHKLRILDLEILLIKNRLMHTIYRKPTNSQMYLDYASCHPLGCKNGIAKGVALRLRRICSTTEDYIKQSKLFMASLVSRGHNPSIVHSEFDKVLKIPRSEIRMKRKRKNMPKTMFITKYNQNAPNVKNIISKNMHILQSDVVAKTLFPSIPTVFKRGKNLKECILRADPYNIRKISNDAHGTTHCGKTCDLCDTLSHGDNFTSLSTGRIFQIRKPISCTTECIIYLFQCRLCHRQGAGSTRDIKKRWRNYKSHTKKAKNTCSITKHFNEVCVCPGNPTGNMCIQLIDCLDNVDHLSIDEKDCLLLEKEKFWIGTLITMHKGMNSTHDWYRKNKNGGEDFDSTYN